jgi:tetratricopeptide (TPR) repeat protein
LGQNRLEEAIAPYEQGLALNPYHAQAWRVLGSVYAQLGRLDEAIIAFQRALEQNPEASDAWDTHRMLAITYSQSGQHETALYHAQMALQSAPEAQQLEMQALVEQLQSLSGVEQ